MMLQKSLRDLGHVLGVRKIKLKVVVRYVVRLSPGMTTQKVSNKNKR